METVYVGIVTYNSAEDIEPCLRALEAQTYSRIELVILDNASQDDTAIRVKNYRSDIKLILNPENVGFGRGHNTILSQCALDTGDFYLALNPDVVLEPDYVDRLVTALEYHAAGWGSGKLLMSDDTSYLYSAGHGLRRDGYAINIGEGMTDDGTFDQSREVFLVSGAAVLFKAEMIKSIVDNDAFFDPAMFMYAEDIDVGWRARRQGWKCWYEARATAVHRGGRFDRWLRTQAQGNLFLTILKNAEGVDLWTYNLPIIVLSCLARLVLTPRSGVDLIRHLLLHGPGSWRKRRAARVPRAEMLAWFAWSRRQPTTQRMGLVARLGSYLQPRR